MPDFRDFLPPPPWELFKPTESDIPGLTAEQLRHADPRFTRAELEAIGRQNIAVDAFLKTADGQEYLRLREARKGYDYNLSPADRKKYLVLRKRYETAGKTKKELAAEKAEEVAEDRERDREEEEE